MDLSSLERIASNLEASLDSWGTWLSFFTLLVVVGLVLEYWYEVKKLATERPFRWKAFQELLGAVLVTVGVAGELLIQFKSSKIETAIRDVNHKIEASLNKQAADATNLAEAEHLARVKLEQEIQPRYLTDDQEEAIGGNLKRFAVRKLLIASQWIDAEAAQLAREIKSALNHAGIGIGDGFIDQIGAYPQIAGSVFNGGGFSGTNIHTGIEVWGTDRAAVEATAQALRSIGKLGSVTTPPQAESPFEAAVPIAIMVGVKPVPEVK